MTKRIAFLAAFLTGFACSAPASAPAAEIGFVEDFALAADRTVPLKQLIPGTEEYYYYHCLHYQNAQQFDKVDELLPLWIKRHNYTARVNEILNRQALLTFEKNPQQTLKRLREQLSLRFDHQQESLDARPDLATKLDAELVSRAALARQALARYENLHGFENAGLEIVTPEQLNPVRRRHLLSQVTRPDYPNLVKLVIDDLNFKDSGGFGSLPAHNILLLTQLDQLLAQKPELLNHQAFVQNYLTRLKPAVEVDWQQDPKALAEHLERLWTFVSRLAPVHNSLKAHVLYHRLAFDRRQGALDQDRLMMYLKLPRHVQYIARSLMEQDESRRYPCNLGMDFSSLTLLPPVGNDEPLVRALLLETFIEAASFEKFTPLVQDVYLKHLFAESKILHGRGEAEQWYSLLPPEQYQQLRQRVDLDFAETNKVAFAPDAPVSVDLWVKNVDTLVVKVFEINTTNFCRQRQAEVSTDVDLDGLVAHEERTVKYSEPPLRRVSRHFEFPTLAKRGVYVIDFIGNGKSSRALIRKGKLRHLVRTSSAGHVFTILDENNKPLPTATLWLAGQEYKPDKSGQITVPFTASPRPQQIVLSHDGFSSLDSFQHEGENYALVAGIYVDRESLLVGRTAKAAIRPQLKINGIPAALSLLSEVKLVVTSTDLDGVVTSKTVPDFKLQHDGESVFELSVPPRMALLSLTLKAKIESLSQNKKLDLEDSQAFALNGIDRTDKTEDLHFSNVGGQFVIDVLGKSGEPRADRAVQLKLKHRLFRDPVELALKSDAKGRITLGSLTDIVSVQATGPQGLAHRWSIPADEATYESQIHARVGETIRVPYLGKEVRTDRSKLSLFELRGGVYFADRFARAVMRRNGGPAEGMLIDNGQLVIEGLEPGEYELYFKEQQRRIAIRVAAGEPRDGYLLGRDRQMELSGNRPLAIAAVEPQQETLTIRLAGTSPATRVHVFATRYQPAYEAFEYFSKVRDAGVLSRKLVIDPSAYVGGRNLGDEYRYIIDRRGAKKFPGNMLARPGLLLNPWAKQSTEAAEQKPAEGSAFEGSPAMRGYGAARSAVSRHGGTASTSQLSNLDFLDVPSAVLLNLKPDKNGLVTIKRADIGPHQQIQVVAVDEVSTACRRIALPETPRKPVALQLAAGLDPKKHFAQQKQVSVLPAGGELKVADIMSSRFEVYDSLPKAYALYLTLSGDAKLAEFSFIVNWHKLKPAEQRELYSKYACHELNFYLMKKDPKFFAAVVKPYLANKRDKTFMDHWLLEDDLKQFMQPWNHARLNAAEQILLAQRIAGERPRTARHVKDLFDLTPPDIDRFTRLFETAVAGRGLDAGVENFHFFIGITNGKDTNEKQGLALQLEKKNSEVAHLQQKVYPVQDLVVPSPAEVPAPVAPPPPASVASPAKPAAPNGTTTSGLIVEQEETEEKLGLAIPEPKLPADPESGLLSGMEGGKRQAGERAGRGPDGGVAPDGTTFGTNVNNGHGRRRKYLGTGDGENDRRKEVRQLYRQLDPTQEWAENNYYQLNQGQQNAQLVTVNAFWNDYAAHDPQRPFVSPNLADASRNFTEMMFALAVLELPNEAAKHETKIDGKQLTLTARSPMIVFHEQVLPTDKVAEKGPDQKDRQAAVPAPLVSENFFRADDRFRFEANRRYDKYVSGEFLTHVVYGCQVVVTNPTSGPRKLDVLLQIPAGAMPLMSGRPLRTVSLLLEPYQTRSLEYFFYFPAAGKFAHYPVQVSQEEELLASTQPATLDVVTKPSQIDKTSWDYISQYGEPRDVIDYLKANNLSRTNLEKIAWRMREADFFRQVIDLLTARHVYQPTLWSYSVHHGDAAAMREYLQHMDPFVSQCGLVLSSPLLVIDPVARGTYEQFEYRPLVNPRAHQLGRRRQILNDRLHAQYETLMTLLSYRTALTDDDLMAVTYYMLLQDRVEEALGFFQRVNADRVATRLQYDYCSAYLAFSSGRPDLAAASVAAKYKDYPVDRWRNAFGDVAAQAAADARGAAVVDARDREQQQTALAAKSAAFDFKVEDRKIVLNHQNLEEINVRYYLLDIEVLFSNNPFVQDRGGAFSAIRPNVAKTVKLAKDAKTTTIELPAELRNNNVLVELSGGGQTRSQAHYANSLVVQMSEPYGQLTVVQAESGKPLSTVYVKVYAKDRSGQVRFYKDGYTDHRGRFDYASLSSSDLSNVQTFAVLVLSDQFGAVVREAAPPNK